MFNRPITFFSVAYVKCGLFEIHKNNSTNVTHGPSPVHKMTRDESSTKCYETEQKCHQNEVVKNQEQDLF